jgi:hypothetical protein
MGGRASAETPELVFIGCTQKTSQKPPEMTPSRHTKNQKKTSQKKQKIPLKSQEKE